MQQMVLSFLKSIVVMVAKAAAYLTALACELLGRLLVALSESIFKISKK